MSAKEINEPNIDAIVAHMEHQFDLKMVCRLGTIQILEWYAVEAWWEYSVIGGSNSSRCHNVWFRNHPHPFGQGTSRTFHLFCGQRCCLKALIKIKDDELDFAHAIEVATETEDAAKVAKENVYGSKPKAVHKLLRTQKSAGKRQVSDKPDAQQTQKCYWCGKTNYLPSVCRFEKAAYLQRLQVYWTFGTSISEESTEEWCPTC